MNAAAGKTQRRNATPMAPEIRLKSASLLQEYFFSNSLNADNTRQPAAETLVLTRMKIQSRGFSTVVIR